MKRTVSLFFLSLLLCFIQAQSGHTYWQELSPYAYELKPGHRATPLAFHAFSLDLEQLARTLRQAPIEKFPWEGGKQIELPLADGSVHPFVIYQSSVMAPALAARFPEIQTYVGQSALNPQLSMRCDLGPQGFHAIIHTSSGTHYLDPYPAVDGTVYLSYAKADYPLADAPASCLLFQNEHDSLPKALQPAMSGSELRRYRLALAATGEYSQFHGGTKSLALGAMVTTLNRVNSIYERELAIRFELVADNDRLIFLDGSTDPYTNTSAAAMLNENQQVLDTAIGSAQYDIGHVFSTAGGGQAEEGVCKSTDKAKGATGLGMPVGDPFDVDFVAHEIGHQFGAAHTFNSRRGGCLGNRVAGSAYEPGSGSTIMAYAGLCLADNLQLQSHDYFHTHSYQQIQAYVTQDSGSTCGQRISTGNTPPQLDPGLSNLVLPILTPFELIGMASDADGDVLSYCWEQHDLGPPGSPQGPAGNAPIFRSFPPRRDSVRVFPDLDDLLRGQLSLGEVYPTYDRDLSFHLTVRDGRASGGGVNLDSVRFQVTSQAGPFEVIFPNGGETLIGGIEIFVSWNPASTEQAPVNCQAVDVLLSIDGGSSFPITLAQGVPNSGSALVVFPDLLTGEARLKVKAADHVFFTLSDNDFNLRPGNVGISQDALPPGLRLGPNPASEQLLLTWEEARPFSFTLFSLEGKRLLHRHFSTPMGGGSLKLGVAQFSTGMYGYEVEWEGKKYRGKILIR
jgi:hypothetical protein